MLVLLTFSLTAQSVDLTNVEYCRVEYIFNKHFTGHMFSFYFLYPSQVVWGLNLHITRTYVQSTKILFLNFNYSPWWKFSECRQRIGCIPYLTGYVISSSKSPWVSATRFIPNWVMKLCEPMRKNINCDDHESLNQHPEASPWLMNQPSHSFGTLYSAHMPFLQVRQSGVHQVWLGLWAGIP